MDYTWNIINLKRTTSDGVVTDVNYKCTVTSGSHQARTTGYLKITGSIDDPDFIPYNDLTKDIVLAWVTGSLDTGSIQTDLSSSFANQIRDFNIISQTSSGTPW